MTTELEAAIDRYSRYSDSDDDNSPYSDFPSPIQRFAADVVIIANVHLAQIDALKRDEEERGKLVDRNWLESLGFRSEAGRFIRDQLQVTNCEGWNFWWSVSGHPHASSRLVDGLNTRGAVLDLLAALGLNP